jgi:hypothetical protein
VTEIVAALQGAAVEGATAAAAAGTGNNNNNNAGGAGEGAGAGAAGTGAGVVQAAAVVDVDEASGILDDPVCLPSAEITNLRWGGRDANKRKQTAALPTPGAKILDPRP